MPSIKSLNAERPILFCVAAALIVSAVLFEVSPKKPEKVINDGQGDTNGQIYVEVFKTAILAAVVAVAFVRYSHPEPSHVVKKGDSNQHILSTILRVSLDCDAGIEESIRTSAVSCDQSAV